MKTIAFIDTEIDFRSRKILDIGSIKCNGNTFHSNSVGGFKQFLNGIRFICGHNIIHHDLKYIEHAVSDAGIDQSNIIDTLYLSPLLFPAKPYHYLLKDDKLQSDESNNPLNDSIKARDLFYDEKETFIQAEEAIKQIFYLLLNNKREFSAFFKFISYTSTDTDVEKLVRDKFHSEICQQAQLTRIIQELPVELAYCLALINARNHLSITPPWVLKNYPEVERIMQLLRNKPCLEGCIYCRQSLDIYRGLKEFFGFDSYRTYESEPLQEKAVKAAVNNKSLLAIFPTGGGKSLTFQVPALMSGKNSKGLTIVISPLQSLMADQVYNLNRMGITEAVTINGLLDPIERAKSFEMVEDGLASILYISPESLRSKTLERSILGRNIVRFVIDEAHCLSSWGHDFRVDYLYIADFIRSIQEKKNLTESIPVSCFTATAKQKVIDDIRNYFREKLGLVLELFTSKATRKNLHYQVVEKKGEEDKYLSLRNLVEANPCPAIIYVSRTRKAEQLADRLSEDGFAAKPYHGKMDPGLKTANQDAFMSGEFPVMVATSAFGMGVDKKDVGMVIHYEISDSLENYVQEAGRAGRDENINAKCYILFDEEDLNKYFIRHNQTKLSIKEIQQVWNAIKGLTKFRSNISNSALEIARKAGWDDNVLEIETRVKTAISTLEDSGYLKRGQNMPKVYANSILSRNAQEAIEKIKASDKFDEKQKVQGIRIIKKLFSSKNRKRNSDEEAEARIDYISDHLGIVKDEVISIVNLLREENILADTKDLTAFLKKGENSNRSLKIVESLCKIENFLLSVFEEQEKTYHLKELNEDAEAKGCDKVTPGNIKTILNYWAVKNWIKRKNHEYSRNHFALAFLSPKGKLKEKTEKRHALAKFIIDYLYEQNKTYLLNENAEEVLIEFSVHGLKSAYDNSPSLFKHDVTIDDIEDTLFYLSRIEAIKIEGGFMVVYNQLTIERLEQDNKKRYKLEDYQKLDQFYESKIQQIHIVGEYAKKMVSDYKEALQFVEDYFHLNYASFLNKYFRGSRQDDIKRTITPAKFRQLFGELSPAQLQIIKDKEARTIVVAAGPGSGKTKELVHKLASLILMEDVKYEQLLMLTFSRAAATEFKKRLLALIGNAANFIEIKTFHSYCFDLLGRLGNLEKSDAIIRHTISKIKNGEVELSKITKTVLVIDEAQDMNKEEYGLVSALIEQNEEIRVIAVGDDDQNIYEFRGSSSEYLKRFISEKSAVKHELNENFRSRKNLVEFTNQFVSTIRSRLKVIPIVSTRPENGTIKIFRYQSGNLITPLVNDIGSAELSGTTCVLTKTNEEALRITGLLLRNGVKAKLIQTNDGFSLRNLVEVRYFLDRINTGDNVIITDDTWKNAKKELADKFGKSSKIELCIQILKDFEATNPRIRYKSDLDVFIQESKLEDFICEPWETILVSTIHKAKWKEFDNIYLMLEEYYPSNDVKKRLLYVAMTRANKNLTLHLNGNYFNSFIAESLEITDDKNIYFPPDEFTLHLAHKDVWLSYFTHREHFVSRLVSGDKLEIDGGQGLSAHGKTVLKFSQSFQKEIESLQAKNYQLKSARVNFITYWKNPELEKEIRIVLPELVFGKNGAI
ncbi:MAG: RecQ family ATP-dependent DNA helicase [Bacteroidales bacterium]